MSAVHIYAPAPLDVRVLWAKCYGCADTGRREKRSPLLVRFYEWHDPHAVCLFCGEHLGCDRPWARGWRKESIASALRKVERARWDVRSPIEVGERAARKDGA